MIWRTTRCHKYNRSRVSGEIRVRIAYRQYWIVIACTTLAALESCSHAAKPRMDEKAAAEAQDRVYEVVVREMITVSGKNGFSQLVFNDQVISDLGGGETLEECEKAVPSRQHWDSDEPPFNSFFDKVYRFFTRGGRYEDSVREETGNDFLQKACRPGPLSQTFHTDLPRTFVDLATLRFAGLGFPFEKSFPGAGGVISLSKAGFDATLDEAIVSSSLVCGGLCGTGWRYVLKRKQGGWVVVAKRMLWVS
jgi:hypothetical protein